MQVMKNRVVNRFEVGRAYIVKVPFIIHPLGTSDSRSRTLQVGEKFLVTRKQVEIDKGHEYTQIQIYLDGSMYQTYHLYDEEFLGLL